MGKDKTRKSQTNRTAKKKPGKKTAAPTGRGVRKKATTRKSASAGKSARKTAAKKTTAKKTTAKKTAASRKKAAPAKKTTARKKAVPKTSSRKKVTATKATTRKAGRKKTTTKKTARKTTTPAKRKTAATRPSKTKKTSAKKATKKKATRSTARKPAPRKGPARSKAPTSAQTGLDLHPGGYYNGIRVCDHPKSLPKKTPYTKKELDKLKTALQEERQRLIAELASLMGVSQEFVELTRENPGYSIHMAEHATDMQTAEANLGVTGIEEERLNQVEQALHRIETNVNHYGLCLACGSKIGIQRLMARPHAHLCMDCQRRYEAIRSRRGV